MGDDFALFLLPCVQECTASLLGQQNGTVFLLFKVLRIQHFLVDTGQHEPVSQNGAQLFHQIQCKAAPPGTGAVQKAHIRVQPGTLQRGGAIAGQQGIGKGQQRVHIIQRRSAAAAGEHKSIVLLQDQRVEPVEVPLCSFAFQPAQLLQILAAFHQR